MTTRTYASKTRPGVVYTASLDGRGRVKCDCPGYARHLFTNARTRPCWHVRELREGAPPREHLAARCAGAGCQRVTRNRIGALPYCGRCAA